MAQSGINQRSLSARQIAMEALIKPVEINVLDPAVLFSTSWLLTLATWTTKIAHGDAWLFRRRSTARGHLVLPNTSFLYSLFPWLYLSLAVAYSSFLYAAYFQGYDQTHLQNIEAPTWTLLAIAFAFEAFGVAAAYILSHASTPTKRWYLKTSLFNWSCCLFFVFLILTVIRMSARSSRLTHAAIMAYGSHCFTTSYDKLHNLTSSLGAASAAWTPGSAFQLDPTWLPLLAAMQASSDDFVYYSRIGWALLFATIGIIAIVFLPSAIGHIMMLRTHVRNANTALQSKRQAVAPFEFQREQQQQTILRRTVSMLAIEVVAVLLAAVIYASLAAWLAVNLDGIIGNERNIRISCA